MNVNHLANPCEDCINLRGIVDKLIFMDVCPSESDTTFMSRISCSICGTPINEEYDRIPDANFEAVSKLALSNSLAHQG